MSLEAAHRSLLSDPSVQFDLTAARPTEMPQWLKMLAQFLASHLTALHELAQLIGYALWAALAGLVVYLLYLLLKTQGVRPERFKPSKASILSEVTPERSVAINLLAEADRMALEGRYDKAVRHLLHRAIADIEGRAPRLIRRDLTSREISALQMLPAPAKNAFTLMAREVEISLFAGRAIDRDAFVACRSAYEAFALPDTWRLNSQEAA